MPFTPNPRQQEAIAHVHGPLLVVAGAGTGKTTVLTRRMVRLVGEGAARPEEILAVTFTDNAAREMRQRVAERLGKAADDILIQTFHSYCYGLLQRHEAGFSVVDEKDLWVYLRRRLRELPLERFLRASAPARFLEALCGFMARCLDELVDAEAFSCFVAQVERGERELPRVKLPGREEFSREELLACWREVANVYETVERMLAEETLGTYGHMILGATSLLRQRPDLLERERARGRFILVDEFQDSNPAQIELVELLAASERNVFAVGDPDQAIYRFRGATSEAFEEFLRRFPETRCLSLLENRRSTGNILKCAHALIRRNPEMAQPQGGGLAVERQPLVSGRDEERAARGELPLSGPVEIVVTASAAGEAYEVAERVSELHDRSGCHWKDIGVLYRMHTHAADVARELRERDIPCAVVGLDLLETDVLRDLLAALRSLESTSDNVSLFRLAVMPRWGVDLGKLQHALGASREQTLAQVLESTAEGKRLLEQLHQMRQEFPLESSEVVALLGAAVERFGLDGERPEVACLCKFVRDWKEKAITRSDRLGEFLEYLDYFRQAGGRLSLDPDPEEDAVRLMTAHAAKGLEFRHVLVLRAKKPSFPHSHQTPLFEFPDSLRRAQARSAGSEKEISEQEERRLFYVAMTRAQDSLTLAAPRSRGKDPMPAGYLRELAVERSLAGALQARPARPVRVELEAAAEPMPAYLLLPARAGLADSPLSASAIESYNVCPLRFRFERDFGLREETGAALHFGSAMHTVLRDYWESVRLGREHPRECVLENFRIAFSALPLEDAYQKGLYLQEGEQQLQRFLEQRQSEPTPEVMGTEKTFRVEIAGIPVVGRIDRLDRIAGKRVRVVDYKTGRPRDQKDADKSLQLSVYALGASLAWELEAERLVFYNLENASAIESTRTAAELRDAEEKVREAAEGIAHQEFEARPGFQCRTCGYRSLCPETEERLATAAPASTAGAGRGG